jgi:hypothetical protein
VGFAGDHFFDARRTFRQRFAAWMLFPFARRRRRNRLAPRFGFDFLARHTWLLFGQQLQLQIAQRFARRPQKSDTLLAQPFLEQLNLGILLLNGQLRPLQRTFQHLKRTCGSAAAIREPLFYGRFC